MKLSVRLILLAMILLLFGLSGNSSKTWAQQESGKLNLYELKQVAQLLIELEERRKQDEIQTIKENLYKASIQGYQASEELHKRQEENLRKQIEAITPKWYDHFWVGAAAVAAFISSIYLVAK